jgi:hypothetical protein
MNREGLRYANIGLAVGIAILVVGAILFKGSEGALEAIGLISFFSAFAVYYLLDERARRRNERRTQ